MFVLFFDIIPNQKQWFIETFDLVQYATKQLGSLKVLHFGKHERNAYWKDSRLYTVSL